MKRRSETFTHVILLRVCSEASHHFPVELTLTRTDGCITTACAPVTYVKNPQHVCKLSQCPHQMAPPWWGVAEINLTRSQRIISNSVVFIESLLYSIHTHIKTARAPTETAAANPGSCSSVTSAPETPPNAFQSLDNFLLDELCWGGVSGAVVPGPHFCWHICFALIVLELFHIGLLCFKLHFIYL